MLEKRKLLIVRGIPGAGKSTYAWKRLSEMDADRHGFVFEADSFFYGPPDFKYKWDSELVEYAHAYCLGRVADQLKNRGDAIVANTFTQWWEIERYITLAEKLGCDVEIVHSLGCFDNIHDVPKEAVDKMEKRFESNEKIYNKIKEARPLHIFVELYEYGPSLDKLTNKMTYSCNFKKVESKCA